jgi:uncharacterized protein (AIM24 family)
MAQFEVLEQEGMRFVKITLRDETVRAEAGALSYMVGNITVHARLPTIAAYIRSTLADEAVIRPEYTGTGAVYLESTFAGFHVFEIKEPWIIESGAYWASEGSVDLGFTRERFMTAFWSGEGFIDLQTRVNGHGKVVVTCQGPVEELALNNERLMAEGKYVIARTKGIKYTIRRPTKTYFGRRLAKERYFRCYEGEGRLLFSSTPYWRVRMLNQLPP